MKKNLTLKLELTSEDALTAQSSSESTGNICIIISLKKKAAAHMKARETEISAVKIILNRIFFKELLNV